MASSSSLKRVILSYLFYSAPAFIFGQDDTANSIQACLIEAGVNATIATDSSWASDIAAFQFRIQPKPVAIAHPENKEEVALSLTCARQASVKVRALGPSHSFQGYAFGDQGNLVISMEAFKDVSFDATTNLLKFGGSAQVGPTAKYLWDNHGRHFPHVRGSHVGMTGSSMGGGFGTTSRIYGTPSDNLVSVEYMLYNGTVINAGLGSDLLWAAQGAGSSFGIVLSATTRTYKPTFEVAVSYTLSLGTVDVDTAAKAFITIQDFLLSDKCPDGLSLRWSLGSYQSAGFFYGDPATFDDVFEPLVTALHSIVPSATLTKTQLAFWDSEVAGTGAGMNAVNGGNLGGRSFFVQSFTTTTDHPFTFDQIKVLYQSYKSFNRTDLSVSGFFDMWGGISRDISDSDSSFAHGKNLWLLRVDGVASGTIPFPSDGTVYMKGLVQPFEDALVQSGTPLRSFVNYIDMELTQKQWSERLYGGNFARLRSIKTTIDPEELFSGYGLAIPGGCKSRAARNL